MRRRRKRRREAAQTVSGLMRAMPNPDYELVNFY